MKKVLKNVLGWIKLIVFFPPLMLWYIGLFTCGIIQQIRIIKSKHPNYTAGQAMNVMDLDRVGEQAWIVLTETIGWTDIKWKRS